MTERCNKCGRFMNEKHKCNNPDFPNNKIHYTALHKWINRNFKMIKECSECKSNNNLDWANISGEYKRDREDWKVLCRSCHMKEDGRILNLKQFKK
jgi:hypothetical protein